MSRPSDTEVASENEHCGSIVTFARPTISDNCGATFSLSQGMVSGSFFTVGQSLVAWTAVNAAGYSYACEFKVTVVDRVAPLVICPPFQVINTTLPITGVSKL